MAQLDKAPVYETGEFQVRILVGTLLYSEIALYGAPYGALFSPESEPRQKLSCSRWRRGVENIPHPIFSGLHFLDIRLERLDINLKMLVHLSSSFLGDGFGFIFGTVFPVCKRFLHNLFYSIVNHLVLYGSSVLVF